MDEMGMDTKKLFLASQVNGFISSNEATIGMNENYYLGSLFGMYNKVGG